MKTARGFVCLATMAMATLWANAAAMYDVRINNPAVVAGMELKAGDYSVDLKGTDALISKDGEKSITVPVTVEQQDKKFDETIINSSDNVIKEIDLGGSKTKLKFK